MSTETTPAARPDRTDMMLRQLSDAADNLDAALAKVIDRATEARTALANGKRATSGLHTILGQTPGDVDTAAGKVETLLQILGTLGLDDEVLLAAYAGDR
jgi:hypothetical protein